MNKLILLLISILMFPAISEAAVNFDGTDDFLSVPDNSSLDFGTGDFSISLWVQPTGVGVDSIISKKDENDFDNAGWSVVVNANRLQMRIADGDSSAFNSVVGKTACIAGEWCNFIVVVDRDVGLTVYLDGVEEGTVDISGETGSVNNAEDVLMGIRTDTINPLPYQGIISEVALWNSVLTNNDIILLAFSRVKRLPLQIQPTNLKLYLPLDDHPHNNTADSANGLIFKDMINNNNATASGSNAQASGHLSYP